MMMEFKKSVTNKVYLILAVVIVFTFLLGYFLPVGLDNVKHLEIEDFFFSTYTVLTQFGFLLLSFVISYFINKEYSDKNILFYRLIKKNSFHFIYNKNIVLLIETFSILLLILISISAFYQKFDHFVFMLFMSSCVIIQYIIIISTIALLSKNILMSIGISIAYWITTVILVAMNKKLFFLAPFDASNTFYRKINAYLNGGPNVDISYILQYTLLYIISLIFIQLLILYLSRERWLRLGLRN